MNVSDRILRYLPYALIVIIPFLVDLPMLVGFLKADPILSNAKLAINMKEPIMHGLATIDPNIAFTSHAIGHRAAEMLFSGEMPWWNHFEGIGTPLAGEMQSAPFFPFTWLQLMPAGNLVEHIALEIAAGLSTYLLLRRLRLPVVAATAGALAYEFNGVFAWLANAICNPVPFLPLLLYGIELVISSAKERKAKGHGVIAVAVALSLYAGFPEVAYLNGILAALWSVVRLQDLQRESIGRAFLALGVGALAGLLLAAPALIPFLDFLPYSNLGTHGSAQPNDQHQSLIAATSTALPYIFGTIFTPHTAAGFWGSIGGYGGGLLSLLAIAGACGKTDRRIRILAAGWIIVCLLVTFGLLPGRWFGAIIPGIRYVYLARYLPSSWILCMTILASFALSDMATARKDPKFINIAAVILGAFVAALAIFAPHVVQPFPNARSIIISSVGIIICLSAVICANMRLFRSHYIVASLLGIESLSLFVVPILSYPRAGVVDLSGVAYLKSHLGLNRFATLGPIVPNYGTYFQLASINYNDLPAFAPWTKWATANLDRNADPTTFDGYVRLAPDGPAAASEVERNLGRFASVGVRYVIAAPEEVLRALKPVFHAPAMTVYEVPDPAPYFQAPGCTIKAIDRDNVVVRCPAVSQLVRREAWMPGWTARANESQLEVRRYGELFQAVSLLQGESHISFTYRPPYISLSLLFSLCGGLLLLGLTLSTAGMSGRGWNSRHQPCAP